MQREVTYTEGYAGIFSIDCETCPLIPAFKALDQKPKPCMSGIATKAQGPVPIHICKHYVKDSIATGENKTLNIQCGKEAE